MKHLTFLAAPVFIFTLLACGNGRPAETTETTTPVTPANSTTQPQTIPVNLDGGNTLTTPATAPVTITPTLPTTITPSGSTVAGLNPEHGQPGHRCDISVGAPLNSKPPAPQAATTISTPVTTPVSTPINISPDKPSQPVAPTAVAPGMNPAHGEPGHRCDIAVGAPLNSKPTTPSVIPQTPVNNQIIPSIVPVKPTQDPKKDNR